MLGGLCGVAAAFAVRRPAELPSGSQPESAIIRATEATAPASVAAAPGASRVADLGEGSTWLQATEQLLRGDALRAISTHPHWEPWRRASIIELPLEIVDALDKARAEVGAAQREFDGAGYQICVERKQRGIATFVWVTPGWIQDSIPGQSQWGDDAGETRLLEPSEGIVTEIRASTEDSQDLSDAYARKARALASLHDLLVRFLLGDADRPR